MSTYWQLLRIYIKWCSYYLKKKITNRNGHGHGQTLCTHTHTYTVHNNQQTDECNSRRVSKKKMHVVLLFDCKRIWFEYISIKSSIWLGCVRGWCESARLVFYSSEIKIYSNWFHVIEFNLFCVVFVCWTIKSIYHSPCLASDGDKKSFDSAKTDQVWLICTALNLLCYQFFYELLFRMRFISR